MERCGKEVNAIIIRWGVWPVVSKDGNNISGKQGDTHRHAVGEIRAKNFIASECSEGMKVRVSRLTLGNCMVLISLTFVDK